MPDNCLKITWQLPVKLSQKLNTKMLLKLSSKCSQNWQQTDKKLQAYASSCMCTQTTYLKKNVTSERFLNRINCIIHQKTYVRRKQAPKSQKYFRFVPFSNIQGKECQNWFEYLKMRQTWKSLLIFCHLYLIFTVQSYIMACLLYFRRWLRG